MEHVVPSALQRLRAADIFRMAGLSAASLGQAYCRSGAVQNTQRLGTHLSGIVEVRHSNGTSTSPSEIQADPPPQVMRYAVLVEVQNATTWTSSCTCNQDPAQLCAHGAALLYQWLAHPASFLLTADTSSSTTESEREEFEQETGMQRNEVPSPGPSITRPLRQTMAQRSSLPQRAHITVSNMQDILGLMGLSELRGIAREYDIQTNGMGKQQLAETIIETLKQPKIVQKVAKTLEETQRHLLATVILAGGIVTDEELRGLYERFKIDEPYQLQQSLLVLQNKGLLFRTNLNSTAQQRSGLSSSLLDVGWFVPLEVRTALRVPVRVTPFYPDEQQKDGAIAATVSHTRPYKILADLLLVARTLDGSPAGQTASWQTYTPTTGEEGRSQENFTFARITGALATDGSGTLPAPPEPLSPSLLGRLQSIIPRSSAYLRFLVRLLSMSGILSLAKEENENPLLRARPDAAAYLLGPNFRETLQKLYEQWTHHASYAELYELREEGVRLRCRTTGLNVPIIRPGELDAENSEARQTLLATIARVPLQQWISYPHFALFMYRLNPLFLQKRQRLFSSPHWWLEQEEGRPLRPLQRSDWLRAENFYLERLLRGPLHWWGACDVALSPEGKLLGFRLTPLASWLLNGGTLPDELSQQEGQARLEDLQALNSEELVLSCSVHNWSFIEVLETFTEAAGVLMDQLHYRLTPGVLSAALSRGQRPVQLLNILRDAASLNQSTTNQSLTEMITRLERWISSYGRVRLYKGVTLLETADPLVMRELSATTSLDEQVIHTIQPTMLVLKRGSAGQITEDLKRRGQAPLVHDEGIYGAE